MGLGQVRLGPIFNMKKKKKIGKEIWKSYFLYTTFSFKSLIVKMKIMVSLRMWKRLGLGIWEMGIEGAFKYGAWEVERGLNIEVGKWKHFFSPKNNI